MRVSLLCSVASVVLATVPALAQAKATFRRRSPAMPFSLRRPSSMRPPTRRPT